MAAEATGRGSGPPVGKGIHLRVAHIAPAFVSPYSGVLTMLTELAAALARRGCDVEVWQLSSWQGAEFADSRNLLSAAGVEMVAMPARSHLRLGTSTARVIAQRRVDVAHVHNVFNLSNVQVARRLSPPYVISPHGGYAAAALSVRKARKLAFRRLFELPMLRAAATVCALTDAEAEEVRRFGVAGPVAVIGNGTPPPPDVDRGAFRAELGIGPAPLAVFIGRLDLYHKGIDELVRAAAEAADWHVVLIGPDFRDGRAQLASLAAELGVADRVHLVGPRRGRALYTAVAAADVFALPSRWEGFPVAILEAAAVGTPALVSPAVEQRIAMAAAGAARVVPPHGWGEALRVFATAPQDQIDQMRRAAAEYAAVRSWSEIAAQYEEVYARAVR